MLLREVQESGVEFCEHLPLIPTINDVCGVTRQATDDEQLATRRERREFDVAEGDEGTVFLGKNITCRRGDARYVEILNTVGFFLYTQCTQNPKSEWPETMGMFSLFINS